MLWFSRNQTASIASSVSSTGGVIDSDNLIEARALAPIDAAPDGTDAKVIEASAQPQRTQDASENIVPVDRNDGAAKNHIPKKPEKNRRPLQRQQVGGIALALGGGAARGWAHIGVLKAVDEMQVPVSMIAGTSIGALVGGSYLAGKLPELEEFATSLTKTNVLRYLDFTLGGPGLMRGQRLANAMDEHMHDVMVEDLPKPFVAIATDITNGHEIWLHDGPLVPAIRASYALPGVFNPVMHNGRQLVDGALVNPVPVSVCRAYEPDLVFAVNLNSEVFGRATVVRASHYRTDHINETKVEFEPSAEGGSWLPFFRKNGKGTKSEKAERLGFTTVMIESFNIIQDRIARARLAGDPPDYTIRPKTSVVSLIDFHRADELIKIGYDETLKRLHELENTGILAEFC